MSHHKAYDDFGIPKKDLREFNAMPEHIRKDVHRWLVRVYQIDIEQPALPTIRRLVGDSERKIQTFYRRLEAFKKLGWRGLINRAKYPAQKSPASSADFVRYLHGLWLANEKSYKNTHLQLLAIWKQGAPIPGYKSTPPKSCSNDCPEGWTYENIICRIKAFRRSFPEKLEALEGLSD